VTAGATGAERIVLVGAGAMGLAMAGHIARAGLPLRVTDIDAGRRRAAAGAGLEVAETLAGAAPGAGILLVIVATDDQSRAVTAEILAHGTPGAVIVIAATNGPDTMRTLAGEAAAAGFALVDAPVVYGLQGAMDGDLVSLCGGGEADIARIRPVLETYSRAIHHVGPVGAGQLAKTANNMLHWAACVANYEVLLLAKRYGLDAQAMREILLDCPARNTTLKRWDTTRFTWHEKDMDVALDLAQAGGVPLPLFGQVDQLVKQLGPEKVKALLYGPEAEYLGTRITPLGSDEGGFGKD
jgi:3-hydroxyisobutyrate dehydrogenase-like beta-hydroxyacid dehydrogenase